MRQVDLSEANEARGTGCRHSRSEVGREVGSRDQSRCR